MAEIDFGSVLADAATGAAGGMVAGPIGAAAGGLLAVVSDLVPALLPHLFGKNTAAVQTAVRSVVVTATGGGTGAADVAALAARDPAAATTLRVQLAQIAAQAEQAQRQADLDTLRTSIADAASARAQTVDLARAGSGTAWGAPVVSVVVLLTFGLVTWTALTRTLPAGSETLLNVLLGMLGTGFVAVTNYWLGSSAGSAAKNELLYRSTPAGK